MIEYIVNNFPLVIATIAVLLVAIVSVMNFFQKPTKEQLDSVREWILLIVIESEKRFGSGTGKIKLRYAYDQFVTKFPYIAKFVTFETFSQYIDQALEEMKKLLKTNSYVKAYVESKD